MTTPGPPVPSRPVPDDPPDEPRPEPDGDPAAEPNAGSTEAPATAGAGRERLYLSAVAGLVVILLIGFLVLRGQDPPTATTTAPVVATTAPTLVPLPKTGASDLGTIDPGPEIPDTFPAAPIETFAPDVVATAPPNTHALPLQPFLVATPKNAGVLSVFATAGAATSSQTLVNPILVNNDPNAKVPLALLVNRATGKDWLEVFLPVRPNGSTGFVKTSDVTLTTHKYHIEVRLSAFSLKVFNGDEVVMDTKIAVAASNTPTPGGLYYTNMLLKPPDPNAGYGTYAYGLSGFSDVLKSFNNGPGQLGIHGGGDDRSIGQRVSHGCIRMRNSDIERLSTVLPLGVPVQIIA